MNESPDFKLPSRSSVDTRREVAQRATKLWPFALLIVIAAISWFLLRPDTIPDQTLVKPVIESIDDALEVLRGNSAIIRNRLKIYSARKNAIAFIGIQKEFGSFHKFAWSFIGDKPKINKFKNFSDIPVTTPESDAFSKELKKRGMNFVGSTIIYAYMQAVGMVNDHTSECWCAPH